MIPKDMIPRHLTGDDLMAFLDDISSKLSAIVAELEDANLGHRLHGSDSTYMDGCKGPLCQQAHRVSARNRTGANPNTYWATVEPIQEWFGQHLVAELRSIEMAAAKARRDVLWHHATQINAGAVANLIQEERETRHAV